MNKCFLTFICAIIFMVSESAKAQLFVPDEALAVDGVVNLPLKFTQPGFTAFQADVSMTGSISASHVEVAIDESLKATHQLITSMLSNGKMRIMILSLNNALIPENTPFCALKIDVGNSDVVLTFSNVFLIDPHGNKTPIKEDATTILKTLQPKSYTASLTLSNDSCPGKILLDISNNNGFSAFKADLVIPRYISIAPQNIKLTNRAKSNHSLSADFVDGSNILRVICVSLTNENFEANSGAVIEIPIEAVDYNGKYVIKATNLKVSEPNGTLHILDDCEAYFDISNLDDPDYGLNLSDMRGQINETLLLPIKLTNKHEICSFQTNLVLPSCASFKTDGIVASTDRITDHKVSATLQNDGSVLLLGVSLTASPFVGNSAAPVCNFPVSFEMPGEYIAKLANVVCATPEGKTIYAPESMARINISKGGVSDIELIKEEMTDCHDFTIIVDGKHVECIGLKEDTVISVYDLGGNVIMTDCDNCFVLPNNGIYIVSPTGYNAKKILIQ